jgi:hypothetical protein
VEVSVFFKEEEEGTGRGEGMDIGRGMKEEYSFAGVVLPLVGLVGFEVAALGLEVISAPIFEDEALPVLVLIVLAICID